MKRGLITIGVFLYFFLLHSSIPAFSQNDSSGHAASDRGLFLRISSGISFVNSTYTSEVVNGGPSGMNNVDDFLGNGYAVPVELMVGYRIKRFKFGLGFSYVSFHVPSLTRTSGSQDSTLATGAVVKNQVKTFGSNYLFPAFAGFELFRKNQFALDVNMNCGIFFHDLHAYDGTYAPSGTANTPGYTFSFGFTPTYNHGNYSFFLSPSFGLNHVSYHGSSNEDLTDLFFTLGIGASYNFN